MYKEKNFVSAVVYVRNVQNEVKDFLDMLIGVLKGNFEHSEIICVNDCSSDKTVDEIKAVAKGTTGMTISVVNLSYFHGLEGAMTAGNNLSIGDFIFEFDSVNLDFTPDTIMRVYRKALEGYDIVSAVSDVRQSLSSSLFYWVVKTLSETSLVMKTERFRILSRRVFNRIDDMNKSVPYRKIVYSNAGLRMASINYTGNGCNKKMDKAEEKYRVRLAVDALLLFTDAGYRLSMTMTVTMMVLAIVMALYSVVIYVSAIPVEGWTTTILFLSVAFFGLFGVLTAIIKYLQLIMTMVFKRKQYSFESIEKLTK